MAIRKRSRITNDVNPEILNFDKRIFILKIERLYSSDREVAFNRNEGCRDTAAIMTTRAMRDGIWKNKPRKIRYRINMRDEYLNR